ncbi:MAG: DUF2125 domain-containing protein [Paracoccus sp. (in: a-proteobacteria)]|nr:DUF2125 domain-containing protein [Paracoccus sp. (in: a-proteobacteria)]
MNQFSAATAIGLILAASPALAELTPKSVWDQMSEYYARGDLTVETASIEEAGDTLSVRGLVLTQTSPTGGLRLDMGDVVLNATGDGNVRVDMPDTMTGKITLKDVDQSDPSDATIDMTISAPGETLIVREDGAGRVYEYVFPMIEVVLDRLETSDGDVLERPAVITLTDMRGSDRTEGTAPMQLAQAGTIAGAELAVNIDQPELKVGGTMTAGAMAFSFDSLIPEQGNLGEQIAEAIKAGLTMQGGGTIASFDMNISFSGVDDYGTESGGTITSNSRDMKVGLAMSADGITYGGSSGAGTVEAMIPDLPVAVSYGVESTEFSLTFPLVASPDDQDAKLLYALNGLTLSDSVWSLFDPSGALPRDPASVMIDVAAKARLDVDILDPTALENATEAPGDISSVSIRKVALSLMGASADVNGEISVPAGGSIEEPVGTINGRFEGVNTLLDKLVAAGLVPQDQVMGIRMMLMMFAKADPANPDLLTTELEFREGGQIFANGQQVK